VVEKVEGLTAVLVEGVGELVAAPRAERVYRRYLSPQELAAADPNPGSIRSRG